MMPGAMGDGGKGARAILLVDDEESMRVTCGRLLSSMGYQVTCAADSREALQTLQRDPSAFDLVLTDQSMPHLSGVELARELHRLRPEIPVVLTSGYSESLQGKTPEALGVHSILWKPYTLDELSRTVGEALAKPWCPVPEVRS
jgi:two-component system, cell cycle sensor histidine kinase and response regulator CckA